ncbi:MAG: carbamoyltransferase HypF, partial [Flavobacteriaceae bacterium]|nr:carbamoyltransferase HypF [Flavobacteriaceae bacterium]
MLQTFKILISGQVQGVGFRPYVYTLAHQFNLKGTVSNNEEGVIIFVTGTLQKSQNFYKKLIDFPPPVSRIKSNTIQEIEYVKFENFNIIPSEKDGYLNLPLTPDFALCEDCKNDIE